MDQFVVGLIEARIKETRVLAKHDAGLVHQGICSHDGADKSCSESNKYLVLK